MFRSPLEIDVDPILLQRWSSVADSGPALNPHCVDVLCLLGG